MTPATTEAADRLDIDLDDKDEPVPIDDLGPGGRVQRVVQAADRPLRAREVADRANVAPIRAQYLLRQMHQAGYVVSVTRDGEPAYHRGDTPF